MEEVLTDTKRTIWQQTMWTRLPEFNERVKESMRVKITSELQGPLPKGEPEQDSEDQGEESEEEGRANGLQGSSHHLTQNAF